MKTIIYVYTIMGTFVLHGNPSMSIVYIFYSKYSWEHVTLNTEYLQDIFVSEEMT